MQEDISKESRSQRFLTWPRLLVLAAAYCLTALLFRPTLLLDAVSSGDDTSYISHAFTIALDFDLRYQNEPVFSPGPKHYLAPSGLVPAHPIGPGLMAAPFVAFFSIFDRISSNPIVRDHTNYPGSWSLFGFFVAAASWFLFGAWLYMDAFEAIGAKTSRWVILLFASGIGVPYYILARPTMGHAFEFAAVALVFWGAVRIMTSGKLNRAIPEICIAFGVLLTMLVRMADANIFLLPIVVWGVLLLCRRGDWPILTFRFDGLVSAIAAGLALLIWVGFNEALYGVAIPGMGDTYGNVSVFVIPSGGLLGIAWEGLRSLPLLWPLLTSSQFGLIYSAPILPFGTLAIALILANHGAQRRLVAAATFIACAIYMAIPLSTVLILKTTGTSYGYRYLFDLLPICLLGSVLVLIDPAYKLTAKVARPVLVLLSLWSLIAMMFLDTNPELTSNRSVNAFGHAESFSMVGYETALVKVVMTPRGWLNMAARRLPGFVAVRFAPTGSNIIGAGASLGPSKAQNAINRIRQVRGSYFWATIVFWLFYPLCFAFLCEDVFHDRAFNLLGRRSPTQKQIEPSSTKNSQRV